MASVYSVSQVNSYIKNMFAQDFALNRIQVKGEVSNLKYHTSGHIYFTLKDGGSALAAVMFAGRRAAGLKFRMQEGQQVIVRGSIEVYERDGRYQLYAKEIEPDGTGDLYRRFVELRDRLEEMGMFAGEYKQPIPRYARTVGIVTASTGAAIRDIMNISARRNPYVQLVLFPAQVQGEGAVPSIVKGIETLDRMGLDVIIVGRGGGSIEDLWAFNEEEVARAVAASEIPVVSAVGHETDFTICDFAADLRAPTPSAAAELCVPDAQGELARVQMLRHSVFQLVQRRMESEQQRLDTLSARAQLQSPIRLLDHWRQSLEALKSRLGQTVSALLLRQNTRLAPLMGKLDALSPLKVLSRGYAIAYHGGRPIYSAAELSAGDQLHLKWADGGAQCAILEVDP